MVQVRYKLNGFMKLTPEVLKEYAGKVSSQTYKEWKRMLVIDMRDNPGDYEKKPVKKVEAEATEEKPKRTRKKKTED